MEGTHVHSAVVDVIKRGVTWYKFSGIPRLKGERSKAQGC